MHVLYIHLLYFLEISPYLKIPPPLKYRHIFQPTHPNKRHPQNLTAWYRVDNNMRMHMRIILLKLCRCVSVNLCRHCPQIVATWYSTLKLNLAMAKFRGNKVILN